MRNNKAGGFEERGQQDDGGFPQVKMMVNMMVKMMVKMKKVSDDDGYLVMKVILWWHLSRDESYLMMKVMIVKEVMTGDVSPVAMFMVSATNALQW